MGYRVSGYSAQGVTFKGVNDFTSIPGLVLWMDGRRAKTIISGKVSGWNSLTPDGRLFSNAVVAERPNNLTDWIDFDDISNVQGVQLRSPKSPSFDFFHDGSPFGYFEIMGYKQGVTGITSRIFTTRAGSGTGANINISNTGNRLVYQIVEAGSLVVGIQTAVGSLPQETVNSIAVTRNSLNEVNNCKLYTNDVASLTTTLDETEVAVGSGNSLGKGFINSKRYLCGLKLLYKWPGATSTQVEVWSANIRTLLEQEKTLFTYPV